MTTFKCHGHPFLDDFGPVEANSADEAVVLAAEHIVYKVEDYNDEYGYMGFLFEEKYKIIVNEREYEVEVTVEPKVEILSSKECQNENI